MDEDVKKLAQWFGLGVAALLILWLGVSLIGRIVSSMASLITTSITAVATVLGFLVKVLMVLLVGVIAVAVPILVLVGFVLAVSAMVNKITKEVSSIKDQFPKLSREESIDATFLATQAGIAALLYYVVTEDILKEVTTVHVVTIAAALSVIAKALHISPVRALKVTGLLTIAALLFALALFLTLRYEIISLRGVSFRLVVDAWDHLEAHKHSPTLMGITFGLDALVLFGSTFYPFTLSGWRRLWRTA